MAHAQGRLGAIALAVVGAMGLTMVGARGAIGAMALARVGARGAIGAMALARVGARGAIGAIALTVVGATGTMALTSVGAMGARAHHSVLPFDGSVPTTIEGTVALVVWQNPHTVIELDTGTDRWTIEGEGASVLSRLGWTAESVRKGDRIRSTGARAKDGRRVMRCRTLVLATGREVPCFPETR